MTSLHISPIFLVLATLILAAPQAYGQVQDFQIGDTKNLSGIILFSSKVGQHEGIYALDLDAKRVRSLITHASNNSYPSWSPDGTRFVFSSDRDGNSEIYISDWDGSNVRRLTQNSVDDANPSWEAAPDLIVYYSDTAADGKDSNIHTINLSTGKNTQLTRFDRRNTTPRLSPKGSSVIYSTNRFWPGWDICEWIIDKKAERCLLTGAQTYCRPSFSPDGKKIAYSFGAFSDIDVAVFDRESEREQKVSKLPGREYDVIWSPKGDLLAFTGEDGRDDIFNIYIAKLTGETQPLLLSPHSIRFLSWTSTKTIELEAQRIREEQLSGKE